MGWNYWSRYEPCQDCGLIAPHNQVHNWPVVRNEDRSPVYWV